ncbi:MAG TPA: arginine--tRNA ligase [Solirubrobacteraceae bacterium]|nr:arginine--tRNA ligase [Solirubrobacteraceae bacterium]
MSASDDPLGELRVAVHEAASAVTGTGHGLAVPPTLEQPKRAGLGDYSTNAGMLLAPSLGAPPREIAERVAGELAKGLGSALDRTEVAGPGFLNLFLSDQWHRRAVATMLAAGERFGAAGVESPERILVEFVSANPTGPLVAASGRHAAYGDALARILAFHGHSVQTEYYFNDAGGQIRLLGESVRARALGAPVPDGGYEGDYVAALAEEIPGAAEADPADVAAQAVALLLAQIKVTLERYGVHFDSFFSERVLHEGSPSAVQRALSELVEGGHAYRTEGALWLRTTSFGDDKDRVLERSNGEPTYLAADVAYLLNKRERGFERQVNPMGADHHGYAVRLKAAFSALGGDPEAIEVPLLQFVHLVEGNQKAAMSKRRGDFVTLDELLDEIGVDATRFFMLQRSHDRTVDLDIELARRESSENPVYYVQYAHARIARMLERAGSERVAAALASVDDWHTGALGDAERTLIKQLIAFPEEIAEAAERRAPHRIVTYALELAQIFTAFYRDCRVVGATPTEVESFRIALSVATKQTIATSLGLLGVSAPDSM